MSYALDFYEMDNEIDELLEELRRERVARGLPADPPAPFVPMPVTCVLMERVMPLRDIVIKYALLVNNAKKVLPLDAEGLRKRYAKDLALLSQSVGLFSGMTGGLLLQTIDEIERAQKDADVESAAEVAEELARIIYINLELTQSIPSLSDMNIEESAEDKAEYDRLKADEALIHAELDKYSAEYEAVRHLL
jgi:hypothetical protein